MDPGAVETVIPLERAPDHPIQKFDATKAPSIFTSAPGGPIPNHGRKKLVVKTPGGQTLAYAGHVVPCAGPFTAVPRLVDCNQFVGFHPKGAFILNIETGETEIIERVDDAYGSVFETVPYSEAKCMLPSEESVKDPVGFQRRP